MRSLDLGELRKMVVLNAGTGDRMGEISDAVVHPTDGRLLGIVLKTVDGEESVLPLASMRIGENAVMAETNAPLEVRSSSTTLAEGVLADGVLVGANVVTDDGRLLGKINNLVIIPELGLVAYKVAGSMLQKVFGGGFYIAGDLPNAFSSDGKRIIVPSDTEEKFAASSVDELLKPPAKASGEESSPVE